MADIVLTTLNAKYIHAAFGLRYLLANLRELASRALLAEFDINQRPLDIAETLLAHNPKIIGFGIYIWNVKPSTEVIRVLKRLQPEIKIILGGPEVSYEVEQQEIVSVADHVITGEADLKFAEVCRVLLKRSGPGDRSAAAVPDSAIDGCLPRIIPADPPDLAQLALPYDLYTDDDIAHRIIYVEASRGCPFSCEFCLSSLEVPVRPIPLPALREQLQRLLDRGVKQFKFVDRTFNLSIATSRALLEFFLERHQLGRFYHFEMIPDRLPGELRDIIARFPPGALQFEVGVQTFNDAVSQRISRRQDYERLEDNFRFLRRQTGVHIHADLIVGLPGETLESFATGFDRLVALGPQEIQVGILKRLRGTLIVRHDAEWQMIYSPLPPYEILSNKSIDFATLQRLRRFARYWDLVGNSGNFVETTSLIWEARAPRAVAGPVLEKSRGTDGAAPATPFFAFLRFSDWLHARAGRSDGIALVRLMEWLFQFLTREQHCDPRLAAEALWRDYQRGGRRDKPAFLKDYLPPETAAPRLKPRVAMPKRQARHLA